LGEHQKNPILLYLRNLTFSKKIEFNEIFCDITIMSQFNFFRYDWFADLRFRVYDAVAALSMYKSFVRSFLKFYQTPNIHKFYHHSKTEYLAKLDTLLVIQLKEHLKTPNVPCSSRLENLLVTVQSWNLGELFTISRLLQDYQNFKKFGVEHLSFFYWKDASSSAYQNYSLLIKSYNLAKACHITLDES
jgi:hypothetical protein